MIRLISITFFLLTITSCNFGDKKSNLLILEKHHPNSIVSFDTLYYLCDSIKTIDDTRKIFNSFYDTVIIENGIFSYLTYNYKQGYCDKAIALTRTALLFESSGQSEKAEEVYQQIIDNYLAELYSDTERIDFSDCDLLAQYEMNSSLLCANAYYKNGDINKAIEVLNPAISCYNNYLCRIHYKFIQLCIIKYGKDKVIQEIDNCVKTIHYKTENTCNDGWKVTIFGADMNLNVEKLFEKKIITPTKATELLQKEEFSRLIQ